MLRPQDNGIRECKRLDGMWAFTPDAAGAGRSDEWWRGPLPDARTIAVPSSYNDLFVDAPVHDHVGDVWYQRPCACPPAGTAGGSCSASTPQPIGVVWVDDERVVEHEGGYTPFEADISHLAAPGRSPGSRPSSTTSSRGSRSRRASSRTTPTAPPPALLPRLLQLRRPAPQRVAVLHAGRARRRHHRRHRRRRVDGHRRGTGRGHGGEDRGVRVALRDADGDQVAQGAARAASCGSPTRTCGQPGHGYLHELTVELLDGDEVVDRYLLPVGIRTVRGRGHRVPHQR